VRDRLATGVRIFEYANGAALGRVGQNINYNHTSGIPLYKGKR